jgi:hypothetical protein
MAPDCSPLAVLAQQGAEVANLVITEKLTGVPQREPSVSDNDQVRHTQSEVVSSVSPNRRLSEHDAWRHIRTALNRNMIINGMTSIMLLKIRGVSGLEHHPHHDGL